MRISDVYRSHEKFWNSLKNVEYKEKTQKTYGEKKLIIRR